jgi:cell shape-determining protein MreC
MIVGKISSMTKEENEPFQNAKVQPILPYKNLTTVFVVINK